VLPNASSVNASDSSGGPVKTGYKKHLSSKTQIWRGRLIAQPKLVGLTTSLRIKYKSESNSLAGVVLGVVLIVGLRFWTRGPEGVSVSRPSRIGRGTQPTRNLRKPYSRLTPQVNPYRGGGCGVVTPHTSPPPPLHDVGLLVFFIDWGLQMFLADPGPGCDTHPPPFGSAWVAKDTQGTNSGARGDSRVHHRVRITGPTHRRPHEQTTPFSNI
jgi:hypothetical protein